jgi:hypothetical protein
MVFFVGIYYIPWKVIMSLYYVGSFPQSYVKEYKTNTPYLLWNSLLLVGILYKEMIKMRIISSHMQYKNENYIIPRAICESNSSCWHILQEECACH